MRHFKYKYMQASDSLVIYVFQYTARFQVA